MDCDSYGFSPADFSQIIVFSSLESPPYGGRKDTPMSNKINEYREALEGAGPRMKELILDRAAQDKEIGLLELRELARMAYPEQA